MENYVEKRISHRHSIEGPITLHSTINNPMEINAHLLNCSKEGICFSSKKQFKPGVTILFKASNGKYLAKSKNGEGCLLRSMSFVTVKWCHESLQNEQSIYIMGAIYVANY